MLPTSINEKGNAPHASSILDLQSNKQGMLVPRMDYQCITEIFRPLPGLMVYDTEFTCLRVFDGDYWQCLSPKIEPGDFSGTIQGLDEGGSGEDRGQGIAVASNGNKYITGLFSGTTTFGGQTFSSAGFTDVLILKYDQDDEIIWARSASGPGIDQGHSVAIDQNENIYVAGTFGGTANFSGMSVTANGLTDAFIAKYNSAGVIQWVQNFGGPSLDEGLDIVIDGLGNPLLCGYFTNTIIINGNTISSLGGADGFYLSLGSNGVFHSFGRIGSAGEDRISAIAVDEQSKYFTGYFENTIAYGGHSATSAGGKDIFIAKTNNVGGPQWVKRSGTVSEENGNDIGVDANGNVIITGQTSKASGAIFLAKYSSIGNLIWSQDIGNHSLDGGQALCIDTNNDIYLTGKFKTLLPFHQTTHPCVGAIDAFVVKYNTNGLGQWCKTFGSLGEDTGIDLTCDLNGEISLTGYFQRCMKIGSEILISGGKSDIFQLTFSGQ